MNQEDHDFVYKRYFKINDVSAVSDNECDILDVKEALEDIIKLITEDKRKLNSNGLLHNTAGHIRTIRIIEEYISERFS